MKKEKHLLIRITFKRSKNSLTNFLTSQTEADTEELEENKFL